MNTTESTPNEATITIQGTRHTIVVAYADGTLRPLVDIVDEVEELLNDAEPDATEDRRWTLLMMAETIAGRIA